MFFTKLGIALTVGVGRNGMFRKRQLESQDKDNGREFDKEDDSEKEETEIFEFDSWYSRRQYLHRLQATGHGHRHGHGYRHSHRNDIEQAHGHGHTDT